MVIVCSGTMLASMSELIFEPPEEEFDLGRCKRTNVVVGVLGQRQCWAILSNGVPYLRDLTGRSLG
jgi:hypothetical protein